MTSQVETISELARIHGRVREEAMGWALQTATPGEAADRIIARAMYYAEWVAEPVLAPECALPERRRPIRRKEEAVSEEDELTDGTPELDRQIEEATPEMIEAGVEELSRYHPDYESKEDAIRRIYSRMASVAANGHHDLSERTAP